MSARVLAVGLFLAAGGLLPAVAAAGPVASVDTFVQAAKLVASDGAVKSFLGRSLAVSADGSTVAVVATGATVAGHLDQGPSTCSAVPRAAGRTPSR
jgi:hypothetical protein